MFYIKHIYAPRNLAKNIKTSFLANAKISQLANKGKAANKIIFLRPKLSPRKLDKMAPVTIPGKIATANQDASSLDILKK